MYFWYIIEFVNINALCLVYMELYCIFQKFTEVYNVYFDSEPFIYYI